MTDRIMSIARRFLPRRRGAVFVSYHRSARTGVFEAMRAKLESRYGPEAVIVDTSDLQPGLPWREQLMEAIARSTAAVAVIGPTWLEEVSDPEDVGLEELAAAFEGGLPVAPVLINEATMPAAEQVAELPAAARRAAGLEAVELRTGRDFDTDAARLLGWLDGYVTPHAGRGRMAAIGLGIVALVAAVVLAVVLWPGGDVPDNGPGPPTYRVAGLDAAGAEGLNVRTGPGTEQPGIAFLTPTADGLTVRGLRGSWSQVGFEGWVSERFVAADTADLDCPAGFAPGRVVNVADDDPDGGLNVRRERRTGVANVRAVLLPDADGFCVGPAQGDTGWREVAVTGWAFSGFLEPDEQSAGS